MPTIADNEKMSDRDIDDNPYAPPETIEETPVEKEAKSARLLGFFHFALVVLATPPFLYCLASPLLLEYRSGWQHARAFLFVVGYTGLFFHKKWAYWFCVIVSCTWMVQTFYAAFAIWSAVIALLAFICALTCQQRQKCNVSRENVDF